MGTCIICGSSTDGRVCSTHEEDVAFEFRGNSPAELTPGRYYRGTVDGFADFGVFVDIGDSVTGLLHRSEVPGRLESLDWDAGDQVYVQVTDVHDNDNVDLGWSIRQADRDFRGHLVDDPSADSDAELPEESASDSESESDAEDDDAASETEQGTADGGTPVADDDSDSEFEFEGDDESTDEETAAPEHADETPSQGSEQTEVTERAVRQPTATDASDEPEADETAEAAGEDEDVETDADDESRPKRVPVADLEDYVDDRVTVEGELVSARQTSGPTVFELADETGAIDCAAFVEAGVRAYPDVEAGDVVRVVGDVERRRGELQVETEDLEALEGTDAQTVEARMEDALHQRATPETTDLLAEDSAVEAITDDLVDAATAIRRAVVEARPVILRHTATVEGYVAGTAIERALLPLIRDEHAREDAEYHYVDRRPLDDAFYTIDDATGDVTNMLEAAERHDEKHPLFVLVGAGSTSESTDAFELLDIYDADAVAVDGGYTDDAAGADVLVSPTKAGEDPVNTGALGTQLAALVNTDVREDLAHLPAVAYWADVPEAYAVLADQTNYSADTLENLRDAIALEAFYQSYEDKRELISDLLWGDADDSLITHVSDQFRERLETEVSTAEPHLSVRGEDGVAFEILDVDDYTHQYDFPPVDLLLDELYRRRDRADVLVGVSGDELRVRSGDTVDVHAVGERLADELPDAGVQPRGARDGRIEFLSGEQDAVVDAVVDAIADQFA
ncbi:OB-fold nucleic acid binding domain-containing protein [Halobacterium bonnevillei]|uniref:S1 RNA-binding domain-containing protein n=1 Tax=Halobacterium bonnevillei TaxID=2692200 RepID=A0A6B0SDD6_9EURY|nr:OB-fold nucleic acid binding domain-containing protein [Halobacterium bonnevillei]MXR19408.1 S1 RNA-binding domain-containing protein [Halobacterium bonnevillei]